MLTRVTRDRQHGLVKGICNLNDNNNNLLMFLVAPPKMYFYKLEVALSFSGWMIISASKEAVIRKL